MTGAGQDVPWWQKAVGYQIYPRSFQDSNGDGIGDIPGIIARLDHLADLGVGFVWLSPVYASPQVDMGYDISDYRAIDPAYGTLDDMDRLIAEAGARGIRIVMDLVVNHCSDRHDWFLKAVADPSAPEHDYFIWRDPGPDGGPPTDARSVFGGPAWTLVPELGRYYFHQFAPGQPDLDWQNPDLRAAIHEMMNWWLDRGIGGFRLDVIDLIGKDPDAGVFAEGPDLHPFLREMHDAAFRGRDTLTVGETWSVTPETALLYCGRDRDELDMVFQFEHVTAFHHPERGKWDPLPFDLPVFKRTLFRWQEALRDDGWNALFLSNHDLPRQVSRYGDDGEWRVRSAKALATAIHLLRGTPFVYQGEEIGMTNTRFTDPDEFRDIEAIGHWAEARARGEELEDFLTGVNANGRDNARTPMQWSDAPNGGFTTGRPWIGVNPNHAEINVAADRADPDGVVAHYRRLIGLRRDRRIVSHGQFVAHAEGHPQVMAYARELDGERLSVVVNLCAQPVSFRVPKGLEVEGESLSANVTPRTQVRGTLDLAPYEAFAVMGPGGESGPG
ncbi:glycoside hydrolase family 13 protein [Jannaschia rubra]|uniref:Oligo-1,6-glucosidase n=1 Tax=Jannaschia rubra TaxID=282197 RepID=A0A0M6XJX8_9RHOB|nr:alpha-glucosidase [Jannaschia rubra]CTQ31409.1 Oligo-1,6-glucosidase [Jannaschia rubra]SFF80119.1 oligo-1,6-glucosidase [Jannaschia rubra]